MGFLQETDSWALDANPLTPSPLTPPNNHSLFCTFNFSVSTWSLSCLEVYAAIPQPKKTLPFLWPSRAKPKLPLLG